MDKNTAKRQMFTSSNDDDCSSCKYYKCSHSNSLDGLFDQGDNIRKYCTQSHVKNVMSNRQHNKYAHVISVLEAMQKVESQNIKDSVKRLDELEDSIKKLIVAVDILQTDTDAVKEENNRIIDDLITAENVISESLTEVFNLRRELLDVQLSPKRKLSIYHSESLYCPEGNENSTLKSVGYVPSIPYFSSIFSSACRLLQSRSFSLKTTEADIVCRPRVESKKPELKRENVTFNNILQPGTLEMDTALEAQHAL